MRKRTLTEEERVLWQQEMHPRPAPCAPKVKKSPAVSEKTSPKSKPAGPIPPLEPVPKRRASAPQAALDLHGLTQAAAHAKLTRFIEEAVASGMRRVLIITGKGKAVLKEAVPRWLEAPRLRAHISAMGPAPREKGGEGALLVLLKKRS